MPFYKNLYHTLAFLPSATYFENDMSYSSEK